MQIHTSRNVSHCLPRRENDTRLNRIAQDRANKVVIFTEARGEFIPDIDFASFGNVADPDVWSQVRGNAER